MSQVYAITDHDGYVLLGEPRVEMAPCGFIVRAEAMMRAKMRLVGLELRWDGLEPSSTWMEQPIEVWPGAIFHAKLEIHISEQIIGPMMVAGAGLEPAASKV